MCIALVGGMDRRERQYVNEAEKFNISLKVFSQPEVNMKAKIRDVDVMAIFTNKTLHRARKEAMKVAKSRGIPVLMCHSCGICSLRACFNCVKKI